MFSLSFCIFSLKNSTHNIVFHSNLHLFTQLRFMAVYAWHLPLHPVLYSSKLSIPQMSARERRISTEILRMLLSGHCILFAGLGDVQQEQKKGFPWHKDARSRRQQLENHHNERYQMLCCLLWFFLSESQTLSPGCCETTALYFKQIFTSFSGNSKFTFLFRKGKIWKIELY